MKEEKKSSKEILSELFDKFNATPPSSPSVHSVNNDETPVIKKECKKKKKKSDKDKVKKRKKKDKKSKKKYDNDKKTKKKRHKSRSSSISCSSVSASETESKSKHKRSKNSHQQDRESSDKPIENKSKKTVELPEPSLLNDSVADSDNFKIKFDKKDPDSLENNKDSAIVLPDVVPTTCKVETSIISFKKNNEENKALLSEPEVLPQVADIFVEELLESANAAKASSGLEKPKVNIKISDLKKCNILELAEQKLKEKAEKYEEGEITSSSEDADALPSVLPVDSDIEDKVEPEAKEEKTKKCSRRKSHKTSHRKKHKSRSGSRGKKDSHSKERHRHKRSRSKSRDRSRSRGRKIRRSDSQEKKKEDRHKKNHSEKSSHKKKEKKESKVERDKTIDKKVEKREAEKKEDKRRHSRERRSRSREPRERERRRNKSKSPLMLPSMILQENPHKKRRRSRSRTRGLEIDKKKLLEIARKNALSMLKQTGVAVPTVADPAKVTTTITAGGKTVDELTDFCKQLSQKEGKDDNIELSPISDSSEDANEKAFHHPFQIKDRPSNIVMNIRNCVALPVKTHQEKTAENAQQLRLQFPVSSGQQHRKTENEWVPVEPKKDEPVPAKQVKPGVKAPVTYAESAPMTIEPPPLPPPELISVFPSVEEPMNINIGDVVGQKLAAIKRLHDNPTDYTAQSLLKDAEEKLSRWNESNQLQQPGLFTGSTGARLLTPAELASGQQAWAKKDQLMCAQPVTEGIGKSLLEKMGWKPGEGLGKNHEGTLEPLSLPLKMDKKGLVCAEEVKRPPRFLSGHNPRNMRKLNVKSLEGKHPVSLLLEYCSKRHLNPPIFNVCFESGPSHKKMFLFKVAVNGVEYQPPSPSNNKKQAKSEAAVVCLRALGIMPSTSAPSTPS